MLAIIIWLVVNQTLTASRNFSAIPVHIINIPEGKTVQGIQPDGRLAKKMTITLVGNKALLDTLTPQDFEIVIDVSNTPDEWVVSLDTQHLVSCNPAIDVTSGITRIHSSQIVLKMSKLVTDQIPVVITQPVGEAPRGYQFLDVWPYHLSVTVSGPEETIKRLKYKEQKITFNLTDIKKSQLDALDQTDSHHVVSFPIPQSWKQIHLPLLSDMPIHIDDPQSEALRIDFIRCHLLPMHQSIPLSIFFPEHTSAILNPQTIHLQYNNFIEEINGIPVLNMPLYANGVDRLFLQIVKNRMKIVIIATPASERDLLEWSIEFINPPQLEDAYVSTLMASTPDYDPHLLQPAIALEVTCTVFSYLKAMTLHSISPFV